MDNVKLEPCPFCGGKARIESNRDWHRLYADHDDDCVFDGEDHALMYPAQPGYLKEIAEVWNRRATPPSPSTASEVDGRAGFLKWHRENFGFAFNDDRSFNDGGMQAIRWEAWNEGSRAALASNPATTTEGWQLVPVEPTHEMVMAGAEHTNPNTEEYEDEKKRLFVSIGRACIAYAAMIAAAPKFTPDRAAKPADSEAKA
jgi:hypothetical protein